MKLWQARNTSCQIDLTEILTASSFSLSITMYLKILCMYLKISSSVCRGKKSQTWEIYFTLPLKRQLLLSNELPNAPCSEISILPLVIAHKPIIFSLAWQIGRMKPFEKGGGLNFCRNSKRLCTESSVPRAQTFRRNVRQSFWHINEEAAMSFQSCWF